MQFIEAKDKNLAEVLSNNRYKIDSFQREYRWQRKHIEALISDLCICFDKFYNHGDTIENYEDYGGYYMGPIVLCDDKKSLSIVDGQQRLTSFTLLLIFLHHSQSQLELRDGQLKDLKQFLYVTKGGKTTLALNVETRNQVIEHLVNSPQEVFANDDNTIDESIHNIIARYEDITKLFPLEFVTQEKLPIFIEWLLDKITLVEVKAYSMDNAYTIFETMNDRGLSLNPTEILKGYLLSKIDDENKSEEMNLFWKNRIGDIKSATGGDGDLDFFRAWLRAKYAETIRTKQSGSENEDFELIGTQFHSWVKNNPNKTYLKHTDDYYFFIRSDFDFFSNLFIKIFKFKNWCTDEFEDLYTSNFYPIADSLYYPLVIAPITKIDDVITANEKINITARFIDIYTLNRSIMSKAITQSTIRYPMYELVKSIRNLNSSELEEALKYELDRVGQKDPFMTFHKMDNWGFYHYLFARLLYLKNNNDDFSSLLRSRKQSSLVLFKIFEIEDNPFIGLDIEWQVRIDSVAGHCLVRRNDLDTILKKRGLNRLKYLFSKGYLPEIQESDIEDINEFFTTRDNNLREQINRLLDY
ncbi:MAG: DUF262 domain-containing protein [Flavipsychrobacter sp.]|nr:DUF262 domain-containing protein [Flavipsychrobacter sp.]